MLRLTRRCAYRLLPALLIPDKPNFCQIISFAPNTGRLFERWGLGEE